MFTLEFPRPTYVKAKDETEKPSEKILRLIASNQRTTIAELAEAMDVTTRSIERNIENLKAQGRLRRVGPDRGGHWVITS
jgi:ATP-dependent DNA helicase RecG